MEKIHSSMVKLFKVNIGCGGGILPPHGYTTQLEIKLGVEFEIIIIKGKGQELEDGFIRTEGVGIFYKGFSDCFENKV